MPQPEGRILLIGVNEAGAHKRFPLHPEGEQDMRDLLIHADASPAMAARTETARGEVGDGSPG